MKLRQGTSEAKRQSLVEMYKIRNSKCVSLCAFACSFGCIHAKMTSENNLGYSANQLTQVPP